MSDNKQDLLAKVQPARRVVLTFVPNGLTLAAILCGFASLLLSQVGQFAWAMAAILTAALLDVADGYAARRLSAQSAIGAQLDSLADFLNFGVAPAILVYNHHLYQLGWPGWLVASAYVLAAAWRLARFNVRAELAALTHEFLGFPSTAAAIALISVGAALSGGTAGAPYNGLAMATAAVAFSGLMVSNLPVPSLSSLVTWLRRFASRA
jgi:CDP-diacylglycerol---serine O-phosphatidyltransferase